MSNPLKLHWPWLIGGAATLVVLWLLSPILAPFAIGAGLAYLGDPIVDRLQLWKLSRTAAVCVVFAVLTLAGLLATLLIAPMLYKQLLSALHSIPDGLRWVQDVALPRLGIALPEDVQLDADGLKQMIGEHWSKAGGFATGIWGSVTHSGAALLHAAADLMLIPVVSFYLLRDWDDLVAWIGGMIPPRHLPRVQQLARETDSMLGAFLRGQLSVMLTQSIIYSIGLSLTGLKFALFIGLLAGLVSFVPYLGFITGIVVAGVAMLAQTHELLPVLWVVLVFGIGHALEHTVLVPMLVGDKIGLHPVAVIFSILAGGQLFGFIGVLLALPAAAIIAVLLRHTKALWLTSPSYLKDAPSSGDDTPAGMP